VARAVTELAGQLDASSVELRDAAHDRQAKAKLPELLARDLSAR